MAKIDEEAAEQELATAARLNERADELAETSDELRQEASRLEQAADDLVAPKPEE